MPRACRRAPTRRSGACRGRRGRPAASPTGRGRRPCSRRRDGRDRAVQAGARGSSRRRSGQMQFRKDQTRPCAGRRPGWQIHRYAPRQRGAASSGRVGLALQHLAATVETGGADVVTQMHFAGRRLDGRARGDQGIVGTVHAALGRRLLVLLNGHEILRNLRGLGLRPLAKPRARTTLEPQAAEKPAIVAVMQEHVKTRALAADDAEHAAWASITFSLERGECGERVGTLFGLRLGLLAGPRQRLWAVGVARHQRQRQQQLILDELARIEVARQGQHIVVAVHVQRGGFRLGVDESQPAVDLHRLLHRLQAALAG
mmetsp:Transcript_1251/g.3583  ORF Transcript_1251/g.3583 Transcript_1251/m.3583 type:complete len:315 (-) Transcript_1251:86-1030(-)